MDSFEDSRLLKPDNLGAAMSSEVWIAPLCLPMRWITRWISLWITLWINLCLNGS